MSAVFVKVGKILGMILGALLLLVLLGYGLVIHQVQIHLTKIYEVPAINLPAVKASDIALGQRIVNIRAACIQCHGNDLSGVKIIDQPLLGQLYGPNITPAALKDWSDADVAKAIRYGLKRDGRPLLVMTSKQYYNLSADDLAAVVAYLRTVPAVEKANGPVHLGPVLNVLYAVGKVPDLVAAELIDRNTDFQVKPVETVSPAFGRYLANISCTACHRDNMSGGPAAAGPPEWPPASNLTPTGLGSWTEADFIKTLRSGINPHGQLLRQPMPVQFTAQMTDTELKALWAYVHSLPALPTPTR